MWWRRTRNVLVELLPRIFLAAVFIQTETMSPFIRFMQPDELWLYRYPRKDPYVSNIALWCIALLIPLTLALTHSIFKRDKEDFIQIMLAVSLALGINCVLTNMIKLIIGRPRPDFFWRCFPDGEMNSELQCTGNMIDVIEGRKSFPSGHSSISFSSLGTMAWWSMGKLKVWSSRRGSAVRFMISFLPFVLALSVALSRICDYHHHWQDVTVGIMLGTSISYMCYRQHFPPISSQYSHKSYSSCYQSINTIQRRESLCSQNSSNVSFPFNTSSTEQLNDVMGDDTDFHSDSKLSSSRKSGLLPIKPPVKWI